MTTETNLSRPETAETPRQQTFLRPYYEISQGGDAYWVNVYMPGVPKENAQINLEQRALTVEGHRQSMAKANWRSRYREIPTGDFRLRLDLNVPINEEKISATSQNGVLKVHLPVAEEAKPRKIAIE